MDELDMDRIILVIRQEWAIMQSKANCIPMDPMDGDDVDDIVDGLRIRLNIYYGND